jgi:hypothetical protein
MDTLLTESMISGFSYSALLLREAASGSVVLKLRGNFRQNSTQLVLIEYHARVGRHRYLLVDVRGDVDSVVAGFVRV